MRIQLLGTSSAEGLPALFCRCEICRRARQLGGKDCRTRAAALIDGELKIDLPPDTLHHVLSCGLDLTSIKYLLFTHTHDDHFAIKELQYMSWMFVTEEWTRRLPVYGPPDAIERIQSELELDILPLDLHPMLPWEPVRLGDWTITPLVANHAPDRDCFNHVIERNGRSLLYATDTGWYSDETWQFLKDRKLSGAVIECTKGLDENGYKAHLSVPEVIRFQEKLLETGALIPGGPLVTTHHSHLSGLLHAEYERHLNPHGIQVGFDGTILNI